MKKMIAIATLLLASTYSFAADSVRGSASSDLKSLGSVWKINPAVQPHLKPNDPVVVYGGEDLGDRGILV